MKWERDCENSLIHCLLTNFKSIIRKDIKKEKNEVKYNFINSYIFFSLLMEKMWKDITLPLLAPLNIKLKI